MGLSDDVTGGSRQSHFGSVVVRHAGRGHCLRWDTRQNLLGHGEVYCKVNLCLGYLLAPAVSNVFLERRIPVGC
jgi:hypothetical protein